MRRVIGLVLVLLVMFVGCERKTATEPVGEGFTCTFDAVYQEMRIKGTLTRKTAGTLELAFTEPATLNGVSAVWDGEKITFSLYGMEFSVDPTAIPESALGQELLTALDAVQRGEGERTTKDGMAVFEGNGKNGAYTLQYDAKTGMPKALSVPALPLEITFFDAK